MTLREAFWIGRELRGSFLLDNTEEELGECFENYSQYSPWEETAAAFNSSRYPDRTWEEFERGLYTAPRGGDKA